MQHNAEFIWPRQTYATKREQNFVQKIIFLNAVFQMRHDFDLINNCAVIGWYNSEVVMRAHLF